MFFLLASLFFFSGNSVLVHCAQGKSRSAVVAAVFLSTRLDVSVQEALAELKGKRAMAEPNPAFRRQLADMEREKVILRIREMWSSE